MTSKDSVISTVYIRIAAKNRLILNFLSAEGAHLRSGTPLLEWALEHTR